LTEDDLQSLVNYVAAKNRLHARYLFGSGVVCGLKVKHEPCKCGKVIVEPGYALDCCGNDIVVSCPQPLDINQMINALMIKLRKGYDCGDPCAKTEAADATASLSPVMTASGTNSQPTGRPKRYCLYVNYCEQGTDPVTPYATSTPCGQSVCQTTRVQEGFSFELRCPTKDCDCTPAICQSLSRCLGDGTKADQIYALAAIQKQIAQRIVSATEPILRGISPEYDPIVVKETMAELTRLEAAGDFDVARLRELMVVALKAASNVARLLTVGKHRLEVTEEMKVSVRKAAEILGQRKDRLPTHLERTYAQALADVIEILVSKYWTFIERGLIDDADLRDLPLEIRFLQWDAVVNRTLMLASIAAMRAVREWLHDRMDQTGTPADPPLEWDANYTLTDGLRVQEIKRIAVSAVHVAENCTQFIRDCRCNALLPPCSTCSDTGVLLACVTVQDCCVTEICNLDRKFVLTGPNLRYWFPEIQRLGRELEKWCCPSRECEQIVPAKVAYGSLPDFGDALFGGMQATSGDTTSTIWTRMDEISKVFTKLRARNGKLGAEHNIDIPADHGLSSALDEIREEISALKIDNAKLRKDLRAEKKSRAEG